jgi:hypothetical protein
LSDAVCCLSGVRTSAATKLFVLYWKAGMRVNGIFRARQSVTNHDVALSCERDWLPLVGARRGQWHQPAFMRSLQLQANGRLLPSPPPHLRRLD